ncbi:sodium-dependent lysophosphatidylcholine symporter 1-B-like [Saccoglossus kowalevskii]
MTTVYSDDEFFNACEDKRNDIAVKTEPLIETVVTTTTTTERLSRRSKLCYAIGGIPFLMCNNVISFYISIFLLEVAGIRPGYASVVVLFKSVWDAITDPTVGILIDKLDSRFGKIKPWLVVSTPFAMLSYFLLWYVPDISDVAKLVYYVLIMCCMQTCLTCYHLPFAAMTMYLSNNQADRDSATAYRMTFEVFGALLGVVIQAQFLTFGMKQGGRKNPCANLDMTLPDNFTSIMDHGNSTFNHTEFDLSTSMPEQSKEKDPMKLAYVLAALTADLVFLVCCIVLTLGTKEKKDDALDRSKSEGSFLSGLKTVLSHGPFIKLLLCFMCALLALMVRTYSNPSCYSVLSCRILYHQ